MFRRYNSRALALNQLGSFRQFSRSSILLVEQDLVERERERELRQQTLRKYGMNIPEMTEYNYGHFSSQGIGSAAVNQAGFSFIPGSGLPLGNTTSSKGQVNWLMLLTGCALVYFSAKIMFQQLNKGIDDFDIPLWTASVETQAKHLIFSVQFDHSTKEDLKRQFHSVRQVNPFFDFFEWVRSVRSDFLHGSRYSAETTMNTVATLLSRTERRDVMMFANTLQRSLWKTGGSPATRLDDFMDSINMGENLLNAAQMTPFVMSSGNRSPAPETVGSEGHVTGFPSNPTIGPHSSTPFEYKETVSW